MTTARRDCLLRYLLCIGAVGVALTLRWFIDPFINDLSVYAPLLAAIALTAWYGGFWPGALATALGILFANLLFVEPYYMLTIPGVGEAMQTALFTTEGLLISVLGGARLAAIRRAKGHVRELQALASELTLTEERLRRQISEGLHDHLQQLLVASRMRLETAARTLHEERPRKLVREANDLLGEALDYTRTLMVQLSPPVLYERGLGEALRWLATDMQRRYGLTVDVRIEPGNPEPTTHEVAVLLYHAVRELLFNTVKHARAERATVRLGGNAEQVWVEVADTGVGFDPRAVEDHSAAAGGLGLRGLRERIERFGGGFTCDSMPGRGTRTTLTVPQTASRAA